jgi:hypothetical protein
VYRACYFPGARFKFQGGGSSLYLPSTYVFPYPPKGMGQAAPCPSLNQLMGCLVPDACCNPTVASSFDASGNQSCYNTTTGSTVPCPIAGSTQSTTPANTGPFGALNVSNLNWGLLAAVLAGLVVFAGVTSK